jgi:hypothetical protein
VASGNCLFNVVDRVLGLLLNQTQHQTQNNNLQKGNVTMFKNPLGNVKKPMLGMMVLAALVTACTEPANTQSASTTTKHSFVSTQSTI